MGKNKNKVIRNIILGSALVIGVAVGGVVALSNLPDKSASAGEAETVVLSRNVHISFTNEECLDSEGCFLMIKEENKLKGYTQINNDGTIEIGDMVLSPGSYSVLLVCNSNNESYKIPLVINENCEYELKIDFADMDNTVIEERSNSSSKE